MGNTPSRKNRKLEKAIQARKVKRVKRWLLKGANPNSYSKKSKYSLLSMAITLREEALVTALIQHGADPDQKSWLTTGKGTLQRRQANDDEYPIHIAASHGSEKIMKALLNSTIDINIGQDHKLGTALHQASRFGHSKLAELLLSHGADIISIDSRLNLPLHVAATYGQTKVAEVLLRYGSPVNLSNMKNWSPLHYASSEGAVSMVKLLLRHGANPNSKDGTGSTPTDLAKSEDVLAAFLQHAIDNPDEDEVFKGEINETENKTKDQPVPPKPARTFALSSSALKGSFVKRERSHSQEMKLETDGHKRLEKSNTYNNFGHWHRNRENKVRDTATKVIEQIEIVHENRQDSHFRRTKSTPLKRKHRHRTKDGTRKIIERSMTQHPISQRLLQIECEEEDKAVNNVEANKMTKNQHPTPNNQPPPLRRTKSTPMRRKHQAKKYQVQDTHPQTKILRAMTQYPIDKRLLQIEIVESEELTEITPVESNESDPVSVTNIRRTNSTPNRKKHRKHRTRPTQNSLTKEKFVRSKSVKLKTQEPIEFKRMYSVRHSRQHTNEVVLTNEEKTIKDSSEDDLTIIVHRRTKSVSALPRRKIRTKNTKPDTEHVIHTTPDNNSVYTKPIKTDEANISAPSSNQSTQKVQETPKNSENLQNHVRKQNLSHSLQDLTNISEDAQNGKITTERDANYNFTSKRKTKRTMSDKFSYRLHKISNSFVKQHKHKEIVEQ